MARPLAPAVALVVKGQRGERGAAAEGRRGAAGPAADQRGGAAGAPAAARSRCEAPAGRVRVRRLHGEWRRGRGDG